MYKFGLDIGIGSVGWAVVGEDGSIIDAGARLFPSADASKNADRRKNRQSRRLARRKKHRLQRLQDLMTQYNINYKNKSNMQPLELRIRGLDTKLSKDELGVALYHLMKHRGISYLEDALEDNKKDSDYGKALTRNAQALKDKYPCQIQFDRYIKQGCYRGDRIVGEEYYSNVFTIQAYLKEIEALITKQQEYHEAWMDKNFIDSYIDIFKGKRKYYEGPGNELSRTDYGKYTTKVNPETGEYITLENIFENLIGKCSVYKDKLRASAASYTAEEYNLLNDLNNLRVNHEMLSYEQKLDIVKAIKESIKSVNMKRIIKKAIDCDIENLSGARVNNKDKEIFHTMECYRKLNRFLLDRNINWDTFSRDKKDEIAHALTINTDREAICKALEKLDLNKDIIEYLADFRNHNKQLFNKWHSFSVDIMKDILDTMYKENKNQMQILTDLGVFKTNRQIMDGQSEIQADLVVENIFNPVVKKSVHQSIKILNALIKKYGYPIDIVIEMARDDNDDERKKRIKKQQKKYEEEIEKILKRIEDEYGLKLLSNHFSYDRKLKTKLRLWNEQDEICPYSGKRINIRDLINNPYLYEIDHIIPISISFDDSRNNKVLVYKLENQNKANMTPYMYLSNINREWDFSVMQDYAKGLYKEAKISRKKLENLLFAMDIRKQDVVKGFINRNLNDTRYASRVVLNAVQDFIQSMDKDTKVKVIRGSFTSQLRNKLRLEKDRDEGYYHHAEDAIIMCYSLIGLNRYKNYNNNVINFDTGEILDVELFNKLPDNKKYEQVVFYESLKNISNNIKAYRDKIRFSHKVDSKVNRQLSNETIYGTRKEDGTVYKISKIKNIYTDDGFKIFRDKVTKRKEDQFLMYRNDKKTFDILLSVMDRYKDTKNPFATYRREFNEPIRKYSRKDNGPFVKSLKYIDGKVGSHIDISHKYGHVEGSKRVVLDKLSPYRADVYYNKKKKTYHIVGLKYADFKYDNCKYVLDNDKYVENLIHEGLLIKGEDFEKLGDKGFEFKFSLYENDIIQYIKDGKTYKERFLSRTMPNVKNYIETKPINKAKFKKRNLTGLSKATEIVKVNTDILGYEHFTVREKYSFN